MSEEAFEVALADGVLCGHRREGDGAPALLLHGGAAVPDYLEGLAAELAPFFTTYRYTQRGTLPSTGAGPHGIETRIEDAVAILDTFEIPRAWAVGHSWGGHLALHLALAHPERLLGVIAIDPVGAYADIFGDVEKGLRRGLAPETVARVDEIEARRRRGEVTEVELVEQFEVLWPQFFADPGQPYAASPVTHSGVEASAAASRSFAEHFGRQTLVNGLPDVRLPVLFIHGELDPVPPESSLRTAALIPGAHVELIPECGHFPWLETPGEVARAVASILA